MTLAFAGVDLTPQAPQSEWADWVRANMKLRAIYPLDRFAWGGMAHADRYGPDSPIQPYVLSWPTNAIRWAQFHAIVSERQLGLIRKAVNKFYGYGGLSLTWYDQAGKLVDDISPTMYMLPAKPLNQLTLGKAVVNGNISEGMYLLTLVDPRYFFWLQIGTPLSAGNASLSWPSVISNLATQLGVTITNDSFALAYSSTTVTPADLTDYAPAVLDTACFYSGQRLIAPLAFNPVAFQTKTPANAAKLVAENIAKATARSKMAGGAFTASDLNWSVASKTAVAFPRNDNGEMYVVTGNAGTGVQTAPNYSPGISGFVGNGETAYFQSTVQATISGGVPSNLATLKSLVAQMGTDYTLWSRLYYDVKYWGIVSFTPDGYHDIEWTYREDEVSTRLIPYQFQTIFPPCCGSGSPTYYSVTTDNLTVNKRITQGATQVSRSTDLTDYAMPAPYNRINATGSFNFYSSTPSAGAPQDGDMYDFTNVGSSSFTLKNDDSSHGTAAYRYSLPGGTDMTVGPGEGWIQKYDGTANRWRVLFHCCGCAGITFVSSSTYTILRTDNNKMVVYTGSSAPTFTLFNPNQAGDNCFKCQIVNGSSASGTSGNMTITPAGGTTLWSSSGSVAIAPFRGMDVYVDATNGWYTCGFPSPLFSPGSTNTVSLAVSNNTDLTFDVTSAIVQFLPNYISGFQMSAPGGASTLTITAGASADSTNAYGIQQSGSFTKTTGSFTAGTGNGALDTGSIAASTWYHVYAISKAAGANPDFLFSTSASSPTMPSTYTLMRRIGSILTDGSKNIIQFNQYGGDFFWGAPVFETGASITVGITAALQALTVPTGVKVRPVTVFFIKNAGGSGSGLFVTGPDQTDGNTTGYYSAIESLINAFTSVSHHPVWTDTSARIRLRSDTASTAVDLGTKGWYDDRGANGF